MLFSKALIASTAALAALVAPVVSVHVTCGIVTCGNYGYCKTGSGAGVILTAQVDGVPVTRQREGACATELYPDCKGEDFGTGLVMYVCTNNPLDVVGGGYCEYNGQRFDFHENSHPVDTCKNIFPQYGPYYSEVAALSYSAGADF